jgi:hypothetical protein
MKQPQEFLENKDIISDDNNEDEEDGRIIIEPFSFDNPKIKVGRDKKEKK